MWVIEGEIGRTVPGSGAWSVVADGACCVCLCWIQVGLYFFFKFESQYFYIYF